MNVKHDTRPRTPRAFGAFFVPLILAAAALLCLSISACRKEEKIRDRHEEILRNEEE